MLLYHLCLEILRQVSFAFHISVMQRVNLYYIGQESAQPMRLIRITAIHALLKPTVMYTDSSEVLVMERCTYNHYIHACNYNCYKDRSVKQLISKTSLKNRNTPKPKAFYVKHKKKIL